MSKILKFSVIVCCILSSFYLLADSKNPDHPAITVALAKQADNKTHVTLTGFIIQRDGNYFLRDLTGQIKLDFPPAKNIKIITNAKVKITGKIKTNLLRLITKSIEPTVRVSSLEIVLSLPDDSPDTGKQL